MSFHGGSLIIIGFANLLFGFGIGIPMSYFGIRRSQKRKEALERIQAVEGVIVSSDVEKHRKTGHGPRYRYRPVIRFKYQFDGRTYTSNRHAYNMLFGSTSRQRAWERADDYPEGKRVPVYVDPHDPENGFLDIEETRQNLTTGFLTFMGLIMTFFGFVGAAVIVVGIVVV